MRSHDFPNDVKFRLSIASLLVALFVAGAAAWALLAGEIPYLPDLPMRREDIAAIYREHPLLLTLGLFLVQVVLAALALPGSAILLLAAGAGYGLVAGTLLCLTACTLGATLAMLGSRHLLRRPVEARFGSHLERLNRGLADEGVYFLFSLRMFPVIPFSLLNLLAGMTSMPTWTFAWVSFAGMLAGTAVYVQAGVELAHVHSLGDALSPGVLAALAAAGLLPLAAHRWRTMRRSLPIRVGNDR